MPLRALVLACLLVILFVSVSGAPFQDATRPPDLPTILGFEAGQAGAAPKGWGGGPTGTILADDKVVHGGSWSARLERTSESPQGYTALTLAIPMDFAGRRIVFSGFLKTDAVTGSAALWLREDGTGGPVEFDNMAGRPINGTTDWTRYSVSLPVNPDARRLFFGVLLSGGGRVWADDLELIVDDHPVAVALRVERAKTALDTDHEFDKGSGIALQAVTPSQVENLATLGRVWGFLKYHHPAVVRGERHWDYELFRVLPGVLAARDRSAANAAILQWVGKLGAVTPCSPCARLDESTIHLRPPLEWLSDRARLGPALSRALTDVYRNRPPGGEQFYVSLVPGVMNATFEHELAYSELKLPDAGYQLLSLFRFWNIVRYWAPYRDVIGVDWDGVLPAFIRRVALARTADAYKLETMALIAAVNDTHANLWSSLVVRPPTGECALPVHVRFVDGHAVVAGYTVEDEGAASGFNPGDIVTTLGGTPVATLVEGWKPYYAASNEPTRLRDIGRAITRGACGEVAVGILRGNAAMTLRPSRVIPPAATSAMFTHDLPGDTFRKLSSEVAYLKLSSVKAAASSRYIDMAAGTRGLVIDIRNYPSEFVPFMLGSLLATKSVEFARFTAGDLVNPGAFHWRGEPLSIAAGKPHYEGKVVVIVDEVTQSQAEYTAMALRAAGAAVVGSTTAGADGNVSTIPLPGGMRSMISGIGVFYPDKKPTQRVGIVADVQATPTVAGIRAGRDEVLEAAVRQILGPGTPTADIERMIREARVTSTPASKQPPTS